MKFNYMKSAAMALAFACCVSSCSDFLEEENKTGATAELEYATVSGIDGLMGSAYSFLRLWAGKPAALAMNGSGRTVNRYVPEIFISASSFSLYTGLSSLRSYIYIHIQP